MRVYERQRECVCEFVYVRVCTSMRVCVCGVTIDDGVDLGVGAHAHDDDQRGQALHGDAADRHTGHRAQRARHR